MLNAKDVSQLMIQDIFGQKPHMDGITVIFDPYLNAGVTPTRRAIQERITDALQALGIPDGDPLELERLLPDGDEFPAGTEISFERDGEETLKIQDAIAEKVIGENVYHDESGRPGYGADPSKPCKLAEDYSKSRLR